MRKSQYFMKKNFAIGTIIILLGISCNANAQGMAVNSTGATANSSAILDVSSTTQGVLIPRMTAAQRTAVSTPATGLLIYQTDGTSGFYFYTGSVWASLNSYTNVTTQGNTFNGVGQLVQLDGSGNMPVINGGALTNLNASNLATGTVGTARLGTGTADSTKFLRGNNTWGAPYACGAVRTVTSSTTLTSSDWVVIDNSTVCCSFFTLFSPSLVPKGFELTLMNTTGGSHGTFFRVPSGISCTTPANGVVTGSGSGSTAGGFTYSAVLIGDGSSMWYWKAGQ